MIADSLETVAGAMNHDGLLAFGGCDKNMPGCVMAMARLNIPSVFVYGGSIMPGVGPHGEDVDIVSIFEAVGQFQAGKIDAEDASQGRVRELPGARLVRRHVHREHDGQRDRGDGLSPAVRGAATRP